MLKLSIPAERSVHALIEHPKVLRVVALSGGFSRQEACRELAKNPRHDRQLQPRAAVRPSPSANRRGVRPDARHRNRRNLRRVGRQGPRLSMDEPEFDPIDFPPPERTEPAKLYLISPQEVGGSFPDRCGRRSTPGSRRRSSCASRTSTSTRLARLAEPLQRICADAAVAFIVNDSIALAKRLGADGVHLGQSRWRRARGAGAARPGGQIGGPVTTAATSRCRRARTARTMSRSAPSTRPRPSPRTIGRRRRSSAGGRAVRAPLRRDRRNHPRQRPAADRCRRRLPRRLPGGVERRRPRGCGPTLRRRYGALATSDIWHTSRDTVGSDRE